MNDCPFCDIPPGKVIFEDNLVVAVFDDFGVNPGHTLIIPKRHVASWFDLTLEEQARTLLMLQRVKEYIDGQYNPDGYNVGFNAGATAGQTVLHAHLHVIPRYSGDVEDPAGGIRGVILDKQKY